MSSQQGSNGSPFYLTFMTTMRKTYFHYTYLWCGLFFALCGVTYWYIMKDDAYSFASVSGFIFCWVFVALSVGILWYYRHDKIVPRPIFRDISIEIGDNEILFPEGYYLKQSTVDKEGRIPASCIDELWTSPCPLAIVINGNEVIYLNYEKDELLAFAERNGIPVSDRVDIWSLICEPYLDTEFQPEEQEQTMQLLADNGVPAEEVLSIRNKIKWTMNAAGYSSMEWVYLGQYDYLHYARRTATRYWWTMEIALRNFEPRKREA